MSENFEKAYRKYSTKSGIEANENVLKAGIVNSRLVVTHGHVNDKHIEPLLLALAQQRDVVELALNFNDDLTDKARFVFLDMDTFLLQNKCFCIVLRIIPSYSFAFICKELRNQHSFRFLRNTHFLCCHHP